MPPSPSTRTPAPIIKASSLILISDERPLRVLLLQRSPHVRFMPNALVFPGGKVDQEDHSLGQHLRSTPQLDHAIQIDHAIQDWSAWGFGSMSEAAQQIACAFRETREETGLSLFEIPSQVPSQMLVYSDLSCVARWLTPDILPRRFDTYFWGAVCKETPSAQVDGEEIVSAHWWSFDDVLTAYKRGEVELAPPTLRILTDLSIFQPQDQDPALLLKRLSRDPYPDPICPVFEKRDGQLSLCLPGDRVYDQKYPDHHVKLYEFCPRSLNTSNQSLRSHRISRSRDNRWTLVVSHDFL